MSQLIKNLVIDSKKLKWCHWKSNIRLSKSILGETDFDIFVSNKYSKRYKSELIKKKFIEFKTVDWYSYKLVSHWLGFDYDSGIILHFHLHEKLITGLKTVKAQELPWGKIIEESIIFDEVNFMPIIPPALEALILITREVSKSSFLKRLIFFLIRKKYIEEKIVLEMNHLLSKSNSNEIREFAKKLWGFEDGQLISNILINKNWESFYNLEKLDKLIKNNLRNFSSKNWYYSALFRIFNIFRRDLCKLIGFINPEVTAKMTMKNPAPMISIIGCDGSGKSLLSKELKNWLNKRVEVKIIYFGSKNMFLKRIKKKLSFLKFFKSNISRVDKKKELNIFNYFMAAYSAYLKLHNLKKSQKFRSLGHLVITDRFPQSDFKLINDGPLLSCKNGLKGLKRKCYLYEKKVFNIFKKITPTTLIHLDISPDIAIKRKPFHDYELLTKKAEISRKIKFRNSKYFSLDASKNFQIVLKESKKIIWETLYES